MGSPKSSATTTTWQSQQTFNSRHKVVYNILPLAACCKCPISFVIFLQGMNEGKNYISVYSVLCGRLKLRRSGVLPLLFLLLLLFYFLSKVVDVNQRIDATSVPVLVFFFVLCCKCLYYLS